MLIDRAQAPDKLSIGGIQFFRFLLFSFFRFLLFGKAAHEALYSKAKRHDIFGRKVEEIKKNILLPSYLCYLHISGSHSVTSLFCSIV